MMNDVADQIKYVVVLKEQWRTMNRFFLELLTMEENREKIFEVIKNIQTIKLVNIIKKS